MPDVRDIHDVLYSISRIFERSPKYIFENICAQISDMCEIIDRGSARIQTDPSFSDGFKFFFFSRERIKETNHTAIYFFINYIILIYLSI